MPIELNATHDPARRSWLESANDPDTDFPIQNLPFGTFSTGGGPRRTGVALGDRIIDLGRLADAGLVQPVDDVAVLLTMPAEALSALRATLSNLYREGGTGDRAKAEAALVPMAEAVLHLPLRPTAFTDFCTSIDHIRRMGAATGAPPALGWTSLPVAYNGRASSVAVSGTPVVRPSGQYELPPKSGDVRYGPEPMFDFELEFGVWLRGGNALGETLSVAEAEASLFGCCLVNDWSARAIQFFEMLLGPHLSKSCLTSISPWIVTMEALAPFRTEARGREADEPAVPAYLLDPADRESGAIDIELTAELAGLQIVRTNLRDLFWTPAQMVAHQASTGAPLEAGDLVASGTVSGAADDAKACLAEITQRGATPIHLPDGSRRVFLEDGDTVSFRGKARRDGYVPIGFGDCSGTIGAAR
jgi:fumarylacetoacetase